MKHLPSIVGIWRQDRFRAGSAERIGSSGHGGDVWRGQDGCSISSYKFCRAVVRSKCLREPGRASGVAVKEFDKRPFTVCVRRTFARCGSKLLPTT